MSQDYAAIRAAITEQLRAAASASAAEGSAARRDGVGRSPDGAARVRVDAKGFLRDVTFDPVAADLDARELRVAFLDALAGAQDAVRPPAPARDPAAALHDDRLSRALVEMLTTGERHGR